MQSQKTQQHVRGRNRGAGLRRIKGERSQAYPAAKNKVITVRFGELWLRGKNRGAYINMLRSNLIRLMAGERFALEYGYDRFIIRPGSDSGLEAIKGGLSHLFGISSYEIGYATEPSLARISRLAREVLLGAGIREGEKLRINAHRTYKGLSFNSMDITREVISIAESMGIDPQIRDYGREIFINVTKDSAYVSMERIKGLGGLPVGTSGKGVVLLSGGIDSPVAAWYAMKRGIKPVYVHFHGFPNAGEAIASKVPRIVSILSAYSPGSRVYYVPSHLFQAGTLKSGRFELILLKAFMLRVAELVAKSEDAEAIFTGESLGQVASQTASNMLAEQYGLKMQILRPLVGFDKQEIINKAMAIGTYGESIKPYRDVCSINARNPATRTDVATIARLIKDERIQGLARRSLKASTIVDSQQGGRETPHPPGRHN